MVRSNNPSYKDNYKQGFDPSYKDSYKDSEIDRIEPGFQQSNYGSIQQS